MLADNLREGEEDENMEKWDRVVELVQHAFETGKMPTAFQASTLILVPKSNVGKYRGIALLKALYKLLSALINRQVCKRVKWHDTVHSFIAKRSCSTAINGGKTGHAAGKAAGPGLPPDLPGPLQSL
jgi:hypothetical protein